MTNDDLNNLMVDLRNTAIEMDLLFLISAISVGIGLSLILRWFYIKYGKAKTNRTIVADSFPLLIISVTLIIYLIKSSIALSLGLVGALSIVRFRAAIKEPEELIFLFFAIAVGLGIGAKQIIPILVIFPLTLVFLFIKYKYFDIKGVEKKILINLKVNSGSKNEAILNEWIKIVSQTGTDGDLHRFEQSETEISATFQIDIKNLNDLDLLRSNMINYEPSTEISFIDNSRPLIIN